ncbi:MAG: NAD(P)-dependent oxidoreductase [Candidatus Baltobacteraceae bacterium]
MNERIGVVGTGRMGGSIALRLHERGYQVAACYDTDREKVQAIAAQTGARACARLAQLTAAADVILTVVTDDGAMRTIFAETGDSLLTGAAGKTFINCATVSPALHVEVEMLCDRAGAAAIEACMASSIPQARAGTLYLMCAGRRADFERVHGILSAMSASLRYAGEAGSAAKIKALVNMVMNINTAGLAEGLGLADALGLDLTLVREIFAQTGANSRVLETDGADMQHRDHECYFSAEHAAKDCGIALALARACALPLPVAQATHQQYERMKAAGLGALDKSAISELTFLSRRPVR